MSKYDNQKYRAWQFLKECQAMELGVREVFPYSASDVDYDIWHVEQIGDEDE